MRTHIPQTSNSLSVKCTQCTLRARADREGGPDTDGHSSHLTDCQHPHNGGVRHQLCHNTSNYRYRSFWRGRWLCCEQVELGHCYVARWLCTGPINSIPWVRSNHSKVALREEHQRGFSNLTRPRVQDTVIKRNQKTDRKRDV